MEVFLYNSNVCRLCGEENDNGTLLYSSEENNQNLCDVINTYLPIRKVIRELHEREREYTKSLHKTTKDGPDVITEKIVYEINTSDGVYQVEHPISLQVAGLEKPKRKRGRPPKKAKTPEELAAEADAKERLMRKQVVTKDQEDSSSGKRRRKTPTRFKEVVQGAELERIFIEEGVTDGEEPEGEPRREAPAPRPEVIGHLEASGELVLFAKGKGRGRPKGRMRQTREQCVICGMEFSCRGRYMSHVAQHGPVRYRCGCGQVFPKRLHFNDHQRDTGHEGLTVEPGAEDSDTPKSDVKVETAPAPASTDPPNIGPELVPEPMKDQASPCLPDISAAVETKQEVSLVEDVDPLGNIVEQLVPDGASMETNPLEVVEATPSASADVAPPPGGAQKLKCNHCDKLFSNKQSKSLHIKAVHLGERPYACKECGATFAYPRSLALHAATHRRRRTGKGFACDLCGKVLSHPSSVVYHKQAVHASQQYVCTCGKRFRHKQLLQRHQLVHTQARPFVCKICSAKFKTKANLMNHQLLHYGVKKFSCEICKHRFSHKTSLTLHMRWHSGVKPFSCGVCGKSFSQKGNLSEHERIHTGEKPYACALCPRRFTTSSQHRLHTARHARVRTTAPRREAAARAPVKCGACDWQGGSRAALADHAKNAHNAPPTKKTRVKNVAPQTSLRQLAPATSLRRLAPAPSTAIKSLVPPPAVKQESLLVSDVLGVNGDAESVIYVTYDADDVDDPDFRILDADQALSLADGKVVSACELYGGPSLLQPLAAPAQPELRLHAPDAPLEDLEHAQHLPVTDEQGNPLHFTMQDGTRLAITSADGKSLQVITQDGQTIPVEINGFSIDQELDTDTVVHQLDLEKGAADSPPAHYFTLV